MAVNVVIMQFFYEIL